MSKTFHLNIFIFLNVIKLNHTSGPPSERLRLRGNGYYFHIKNVHSEKWSREAATNSGRAKLYHICKLTLKGGIPVSTGSCPQRDVLVSGIGFYGVGLAQGQPSEAYSQSGWATRVQGSRKRSLSENTKRYSRDQRASQPEKSRTRQDQGAGSRPGTRKEARGVKGEEGGGEIPGG